MDNEAKYHQDLEKQASASVFRVLSATNDDLTIIHGSDTRMMGNHKVRIGTLPTNISVQKRREHQGESDYLAINMRYHDDDTHRNFILHDDVANMVFQSLEEARQEILGGQYKIGVQQNLTSFHEKQLIARGINRTDDNQDNNTSDSVFLGDALRLLMRQAAGHDLSSTIYANRLSQRYYQDYFDKIMQLLNRTNLNDQSDFARDCHQFLRDVGILDTPFEPPADEMGDDDPENQQDDNDNINNMQNLGENDTSEQDQTSEREESSGDQGEATEQDYQEFTEDQEMGDNSADEELLDGSEEAGTSPMRPEHDLGDVPISEFYKIYCDKYDEIIDAGDLVESDEKLQQYRGQLDSQMQSFQGLVGKLANRLQRLLLAHQLRAWQFDLEEGMLDTAKLTRVITNPLNSLSFKHEDEKEFKDTIVTLLIDNSGSMRGRPITIAALSTDILTTTLERCGVKVEVLGFTTKTWKGGKSREEWNNNGKPKEPGRLTDLRHIIYKGANEPYRRARKKFGLMLQEGLLKENIDGEALLWAYNRLKVRHEERKILMVISDGAPVDDSTLALNEGNYLERHLRDVIYHIENKSNIELTAIGIGHDVTRYYQRAVTIHDAEHLTNVMAEQLSTLFSQKKKRK